MEVNFHLIVGTAYLLSLRCAVLCCAVHAAAALLPAAVLCAVDGDEGEGGSSGFSANAPVTKYFVLFSPYSQNKHYKKV